MELTKNEMDTIYYTAFKYYIRSNGYIQLDDLIAEGTLTFLVKIKSFDPEKNVNRMAYAFKRVWGSMLDYIAKEHPLRAYAVRPSLLKKGKSINTFSDTFIDKSMKEINLEGIEKKDDPLMEEYLKEELYEIYYKVLKELKLTLYSRLFGYIILEGMSLEKGVRFYYANTKEFKRRPNKKEYLAKRVVFFRPLLTRAYERLSEYGSPAPTLS
jgi:RNA polymerase sigma factor (sigma-70 family)